MAVTASSTWMVTFSLRTSFRSFSYYRSRVTSWLPETVLKVSAWTVWRSFCEPKDFPFGVIVYRIFIIQADKGFCVYFGQRPWFHFLPSRLSFRSRLSTSPVLSVAWTTSEILLLCSVRSWERKYQGVVFIVAFFLFQIPSPDSFSFFSCGAVVKWCKLLVPFSGLGAAVLLKSCRWLFRWTVCLICTP